jgi:F-type H+-transporting ATPase subunit gamma
MATERELNKRIKSIKNISQVTSALAAVSASKAARAQRQVEATRAYAGKAFEILNNLASQPGVGTTGHPLLTTRSEIKNAAIILVTGDRGLAGAYNTNVVNQTQHFMSALSVPVQVITIGRKGRDLMIRRGYNVVASFDGMPGTPSILDITPIAQVVTDDYLAGKVDEVFIVVSQRRKPPIAVSRASCGVSRDSGESKLEPMKPSNSTSYSLVSHSRISR